METKLKEAMMKKKEKSDKKPSMPAPKKKSCK